MDHIAGFKISYVRMYAPYVIDRCVYVSKNLFGFDFDDTIRAVSTPKLLDDSVLNTQSKSSRFYI